MCYLCNRGDALRHCAEELCEMAPGYVFSCGCILASIWCIECFVCGSSIACTHIYKYIALLLGLVLGKAIIVVAVRLWDVRKTKKDSTRFGHRCYACGKVIDDAD